MPNWKLLRHPTTGKLLKNLAGNLVKYDADVYPDGPPSECCCIEGCCDDRECSTWPASVFVTLSGFGCWLDDTWELTGGCSELGGGETALEWGTIMGEQADCNPENSMSLACIRGEGDEPDRFALAIDMSGLFDGTAFDWVMTFSIVSCDPFMLVSNGFTGSILPPEEETVCGCSPAGPSGTVTE